MNGDRLKWEVHMAAIADHYLKATVGRGEVVLEDRTSGHSFTRAEVRARFDLKDGMRVRRSILTIPESQNGLLDSALVAGWMLGKVATSEILRDGEPVREFAYPSKNALQRDKFEAFTEAAKPGAIFVNEYGARSEIVRPNDERNANLRDSQIPEFGPWYIVKFFWTDSEPTEESLPWWQIGEPLTADEAKA